MPDFKVTRADLMGAAEAGHARGAPDGELKLAEDQDPDAYIKVGKRTQVPSFSTGHGPSLEQMKQDLVIIEVEEEVEEIRHPQTGEVVETIYHPKTRAIMPGTPDHPFNKGESRCPIPEMKSVPTEISQATAQLLKELPTADLPPASDSLTPQNPTSNGDNVLLASVLKLVDGLAQTQSNMMEMLLESRQEKTSSGPACTEQNPVSHPSSEALDSALATSKESPSSSPQADRSSTSMSPNPPPTASLTTMNPEVPLVWHTPHGQFRCRCLKLATKPSGDGTLVIVVYLEDQDHAFVPAASDETLLLEVRSQEEGDNPVHLQVTASGLDFSLELGGVGYKLVILCKVE